MLQVDHATSNDVVALEEIPVISLDVKPIVLARELLTEQKTIVEAGLSCLAAVVAVRFEGVLRVKEGTNVDITGALVVHHLDFLGIPDD